MSIAAFCPDTGGATITDAATKLRTTIAAHRVTDTARGTTVHSDAAHGTTILPDAAQPTTPYAATTTFPLSAAAYSSTFVRRIVRALLALVSLLWRFGDRVFSFIAAGGAVWEFVVPSKSTYRV